MHGMVNIAVRAARRAGELMIRQLNQLESLKVVEKSPNEFVTQVDQAAEAAIIEVIQDHYPDHSILAEESGASGDHEYQWMIDPLDGTTNYLHGFPQFSRVDRRDAHGRARARRGLRPVASGDLQRRAAGKARSSTVARSASASARTLQHSLIGDRLSVSRQP